MAWKLPN